MVPSTCSCASTAPLVWSIAASRCTGRPWGPIAQRRLLPSTATARQRHGPGGRRRSASHAPTAATSASPPTRARVRRSVASPGGCRVPVSGSRRAPSATKTGWGASAAHSLIAVRDRAPASTAAAATASMLTSACRRPLRSRGSGTTARRSSRPGHSPSPSGAASQSWVRTGGIGDDGSAGTVFRRGHEALRTA